MPIRESSVIDAIICRGVAGTRTLHEQCATNLRLDTTGGSLGSGIPPLLGVERASIGRPAVHEYMT
jgi:hypothetical protein